MPERRRTRWRIAGFFGLAAVITAAVIGVRYRTPSTGPDESSRADTAVARTKDSAPSIAMINEALKNGDQKMLPLLREHVVAAKQAPTALTDIETSESIDSLVALRTGFPTFNGPSRVVAAALSCQILDRFGVEPAPARWVDALIPVHDLLTASLSGTDLNVRVAALSEMARFWVWLPGRSLTPLEERQLSDWKESIFSPVVRCLASRDILTRAAAVACLGHLPLDDRAVAAIPYLEDRTSVEVRKQTLVSFSRRPTILTDDLVLKRLNDEDAAIRETAELILKTRGFSREQVSMGALIFNPKPEHRISVIPMLKNRTDLDPVVWLVQLSRDPVEMVRISAIEALAAHDTPIVQRRLAEMAQTDVSETVRRAASKATPVSRETTAALPPLPSSTSLNRKAN